MHVERQIMTRMFQSVWLFKLLLFLHQVRQKDVSITSWPSTAGVQLTEYSRSSPGLETSLWNFGTRPTTCRLVSVHPTEMMPFNTGLLDSQFNCAVFIFFCSDMMHSVSIVEWDCCNKDSLFSSAFLLIHVCCRSIYLFKLEAEGKVCAVQCDWLQN